MWPSSLFVPLNPGPGMLQDQSHLEMRIANGMVQWCFLPVDPYTCQVSIARNQLPAQSLSNEEARKFLLNRSVFDLVKITRFLELSDPKLLGWYLSLPVQDRKLIQEEGGLLKFLQKHPALGVTSQIVFVKRQVLAECEPEILQAMSSDLNKSRRPAYYCMSQCNNCGASISFSSTKCKWCNAPTKIPGRTLDLPVEDKELDLLPNTLKEELNLCNANAVQGNVGAPEQLRSGQKSAEQAPDPATNLQESFQSACDRSHTGEAPPCQQEGENCRTRMLNKLWEEEVQQEGTAGTVYKDSEAQASFSLDVELELHSQTPKGVCSVGERGVSGAEDAADVPDLAEEMLPEYYSFNSTGLDSTNGPDCSGLDLAAESGTELPGAEDVRSEAESSDTLSCFEQCASVDSTSCCSKHSEWMDDDHLDESASDDGSRCDLKNEVYHSVMEEEPLEGGASWVSLQAPTQRDYQEVKDRAVDPKANSAVLEGPAEIDQSDLLDEKETGAQQNPLADGSARSVCEDNSRPPFVDSSAALCERCLASGAQITMSQSVDASGDFRASYTSTRATEARPSVASKSTNTKVPCATQDASVNTDCALPHHPSQDQETQTLATRTAEKYVITDVYMADLDYFTEEFIKLKLAQDELSKVKTKSASSDGEVQNGHCEGGGGCGCCQRAERAELRLLALQYGMCQQHCWRRYYTSPEGECRLLRTEVPPVSMLGVLQDLEDEYQQMKRKILSGVSLDKLHPLSVDSLRISSQAEYIPAQMLQEYLSEDGSPGADQRGQEQPVHHDGEGRGRGRASPVSCRSTTSMEKRQSEGAPVANPKPSSIKHGRAGTLLTIGHKPGGAKDLDSSEAWYDAEEDFGPSAQEGGAEHSDCELSLGGVIGEGEEDQGCLLCVSNLPGDVTRDEIMSCFGKYKVSDVCIATFSNNLRAAIVKVSGHGSAEAAEEALNRHAIRGHDLRVELIRRSLATGQGLQRKPAEMSTRAGPVEDGQRSGGSNRGAAPMTSKLLQGRLEKLMNVQDSPTPSGTCVPQHYATMGSFDTLMARLTERHPEAGRQRIVEALLELRTQHQGLLSGLPLKTIVEMTSALLTRPSTSA